MSSFSATFTSTPTEIAAGPESPKEIVLVSGGTVYHKNAKDVDSGDTALEAGAVQITESKFFISATTSEVVVRELKTSTVEDMTTVDDLTVGDDLTVAGKATVAETLGVTGASTLTGGSVSSGGLPGVYAGGWVPPTAESGTDTKLVEKKLFLTSVFLPANKELTGVAILVGATGGKGKVVAALFDATGAVLAKSSETTEGTALGTAKEIQKLAFTAKYKAVGPKTFFVGLTGNGTEEGTFRTIPSNTASDNVWTAEKELAEKCKMATFTEPPSTFTGAKGPVAMLY